MRKAGLFHPFLLLLCWTGLVSTGSYVLVTTAVRQRAAVHYAVTKGRIIRSEVGQSHIIRRGVEVEYTYAVNGVKYDGHRFRYDDHNITFEWESAVEGLPRGAERKVYYDPKDPADSLLQPGIDGGDLLLLLFTLPLGVLTVTLWHGLFSRWRDTKGVGPAGGVQVVKRKGRTRAKLGQTSALGAGFYALAGAAFVGAFPAVIFGGFDPPVRTMEIVWLTVLVVGVGVFLWRAALGWSGVYELRIDDTTQTVVLPQTGGRSKPVSLSRAEIAGVSLQKRICRSPSGTHFSYLPALNRNGSSAGEPPLKLISWGWSEAKARAFAEWLGQELGVQFKGIAEEPNWPPIKTEVLPAS